MTDPGILTLTIVLAVALYVWLAASLQAVFRKAGEAQWQAWVPVLSLVVLLRLGGFSAWWVLLAIVPVVGLIVLVPAYHRVSAAFGYGAGMTVLAVLLPPVWTSALGWGSERWLGVPVAHAAGAGPVRRGDPLAGRFGAAAYPPRPPLPTRSVFPGSSPAPGPIAPPFADPASGYAPAGAPRRSTIEWWADAEDSVAQPRSERPRVPYTGSIPIIRDGSAAPAFAAPSPAAPRRAVIPGADAAAEGAPEAAADPYAAPAPALDDLQAPPPVSAIDPWAPPVSGSDPLPVWAGRALRSSPAPETGDSAFDTSAEVSAVAGAPRLGVPMSARSSVSAVQPGSALPDPEDAFDETILASRRRTEWTLIPPLGAPIAISSDVLIVGRRPASDPDFADAQLVPVSDETRTMPKTHARLELQGDGWVIVDLDSTNGVALFREDGSEFEATPGVPERVFDRFLLGDAALRLAKGSAGS